ncbi:hypothetical protein CDAR_60151 [Caerostris darwini]|uniref:Uncharacterized protein n=1 Tax=Caerostris darwini TaxID=1538125 RepID=A0AAV4QLM6_9ARAC|nr:hypothetical protein CDAR_60151 [Caerostris darwini]
MFELKYQKFTEGHSRQTVFCSLFNPRRDVWVNAQTSSQTSRADNKVSRLISLETQNHEIKTNKSGTLCSNFHCEKLRGEPLGPTPSQTFSLFDILSETPSTFHYRHSDALIPHPLTHQPKESRTPIAIQDNG